MKKILRELELLLNKKDKKLFYHGLDYEGEYFGVNKWNSLHLYPPNEDRELIKGLLISDLIKLKIDIDDAIEKLEKWS